MEERSSKSFPKITVGGETIGIGRPMSVLNNDFPLGIEIVIDADESFDKTIMDDVSNHGHESQKYCNRIYIPFVEKACVTLFETIHEADDRGIELMFLNVFLHFPTLSVDIVSFHSVAFWMDHEDK